MMTNAIKMVYDNFRIVGGLNIRKPKLLKKMFRGFFKSHFGKMPVLRFMDVALSYECNFKCTHCSAALFEKNEGMRLSNSDYSRIAEDAMGAGVMVFNFTGGEPLLCHDLLEKIKLFRPHENLISIATNGWLVDDQFLEDYRKIGGDILCISVDSPDAQSHDEFRKYTGSWERAVTVLEKARQQNLQTFIAYTVTHLNIRSDDFLNMIALAGKLGAFLNLNLAVPAGKWIENQELLLDANDRVQLNYILKKHSFVRTDFESNWRVRGCPAFKEKCYLTPYGDVLPCPFIHISFGNVQKQSLMEIRKNALEFEYLNAYHPICIAGEDKNFIENAGCYAGKSCRLPIGYKDSPIFK